jgi:glyoxylase-like metal-dependent hydrolase (beta-lactamase superfamily II)
MNRRTLIKQAGALCMATALPLNNTLAAPVANKPESNGFYSFPLGKLNILVVSDGHAIFNPIQPTFAPGVPSSMVKAVLHDHFVPEDYLDLGINILVVRKEDRVILFDTGCGSVYGANSGKLVSNLAAAGIAATDVTDIVLTHAHIDHIGGLLSKERVPVFTNATVYLSETEYRFWMNEKPDFSQSKVIAEKREAMIQFAQQTLTTIKSKLQFYKEDDILFDCIKMHEAPGHTPGHTIGYLFSENEELVHLADIAHTHVLLLSHPEWGNSLDTNFAQAITTRQNVLSEMEVSRKRVFSYHFPYPGLGFIKKTNQSFEWVAQSFAYPNIP